MRGRRRNVSGRHQRHTRCIERNERDLTPIADNLCDCAAERMSGDHEVIGVRIAADELLRLAEV